MSDPQVQLDRSKEYATVHGERSPDDLHAATHFYQDGLPFDGEGILIADHPELQGDNPRVVKLRAIVEKRTKQAIKAHEKAEAKAAGDEPADAESEAVDEDEEALSDGELIRAWLRGRDVVWNDLTQAVARKTGRRVSSKRDAVVWLVSQNYCSAEQLAPAYQSMIRD
jgi:hypothetical protein